MLVAGETCLPFCLPPEPSHRGLGSAGSSLFCPNWASSGFHFCFCHSEILKSWSLFLHSGWQSSLFIWKVFLSSLSLLLTHCQIWGVRFCFASWQPVLVKLPISCCVEIWVSWEPFRFHLLSRWCLLTPPFHWGARWFFQEKIPPFPPCFSRKGNSCSTFVMLLITGVRGMWVSVTNCPLCAQHSGPVNNQGLASALCLVQGETLLHKCTGSFRHLIVSFWASLRAGCNNSMNHGKEGVPHEAKSRCRYSHQYDNRVYTCKVSPPRFCLLQQLAGWSPSPFGKTGLGPLFAASKVFDINIEYLELLLSCNQKNSHVFLAGAPWFVFWSLFSPYSVELVGKGHIHWLFIPLKRSVLQEPNFDWFLLSVTGV